MNFTFEISKIFVTCYLVVVEIFGTEFFTTVQLFPNRQRISFPCVDNLYENVWKKVKLEKYSSQIFFFEIIHSKWEQRLKGAATVTFCSFKFRESNINWAMHWHHSQIWQMSGFKKYKISFLSITCPWKQKYVIVWTDMV